MKTVDFSVTIAACDLKVGRCRQLMEFMKVSFLDQGPRPFTYKNLNLLFSETTGPFLTKICM